MQRFYYSLFFLLFLSSCFSIPVISQVTGGKSIFTGLILENSPRIMALGSMTQSNPSGDINFILQNPAILDSNADRQASVNFLSYYSQTQMYYVAYGKYSAPLKTLFTAATSYINYGNMDRTDIYGNQEGSVSAIDYQLLLGASRYYKSNWQYGASLKFAGANYAGYGTLALMLDLGVYRQDTLRNLSYGMSFKNIGTQIRKFSYQNGSESMPYDLQIGISKKLEHIPFRFGITAHHLYKWDIRYNNPADRVSDVFLNGNPDDNKSYFFDKLFRHLIFSGELLLSTKLAFTASYNHLRRSELGLYQQAGLSGFAFGMNLHYKKWELNYAKSIYNQTGGTNFVGLNLYLQNF